VDGAEIVAVHPAPNENAWLLGLVAVREQRLTAQQDVGPVGARGVGPTRVKVRTSAARVQQRRATA
jgi:hypothetical protein